MAVVYRIEQLTKVYRGSAKKANNRLTLSIQEGEIFGLLGPNGSGKSTLVNQITGITRPTTGNIELFGIDVVKNPAVIPEYVALQPQHVNALMDLYPQEALLYTAQLRHITEAVARKQTQALMEELELDPYRKRLIRHLSGGLQKLVSLALAFVGERPVQIFDEPTNELDPVVRRRVWDKLLSLHRQGKTIIIVTHNVLEAERVIERVGIINNGQLLALGSVGDLKERIDQRIRLELLLKTEFQEASRHHILKSLGEVRALTEQHWVILCPRVKTQSTINQIFGQIGMENLEDFRILTPTLEDVYLQLGEKQNLVKPVHKQHLVAVPDARSTSHVGTARVRLISIPSSGSRKGIGSHSLPSGKVYPLNPNGSSGNALSPLGQAQQELYPSWYGDSISLEKNVSPGSSAEADGVLGFVDAKQTLIVPLSEKALHPQVTQEAASPPYARSRTTLATLTWQYIILLRVFLAEYRTTWFFHVFSGLLIPIGFAFFIATLGATSSSEKAIYLLGGNMALSITTGPTSFLITKIGSARQNKEFHYWIALPIAKLLMVLAVISVALLFALPGLLGIYVFGSLLLGLPFEAASWMLLPLVPLGVLPLAGLGALLGLLAKSGEEAGVFSSLLIVFVGVLSPVILPLESLPVPLRIISQFMPTTYVADAFRAVLGGYQQANLAFDILVLALFSAVLLTITYFRLDWRK